MDIIVNKRSSVSSSTVSEVVDFTLQLLIFHVSHSSAAHFRNALSSQFSAQDTGGDLQTDSVDPFPDNSHRTYACPMPNCFKAYRQHSGLRYHLLHVRWHYLLVM